MRIYPAGIPSLRRARGLRHEADSYYAHRRNRHAPALRRLGLEPDFVPDVAERLHCFDMDHTGPSWLACLETVVESWLEAGELDGTEQALDRMRVRLDPSPSARLSRATEAIPARRLRLAQGKVEPALTAAEPALEYTSGGAPWWRAKAIRVLEAAVSASPALVEEAASIEAGLGIR